MSQVVPLRGGLGRISGVLVDLSGTLHVGDTPVTSAVTALASLRNTGLPIRFITNTTKESRRQLISRLHNIGFPMKQNEVFTTLTAARLVVEQSELRPLLLLEDSATEDFEGISTEDPNCVVVGLAPSLFDYHHLNRAFKLLLNGGQLIAVHKAKYYKREDGLALGPGPFVSALEYASDKEALVVGKPEPGFFESVLSELNCPADEVVMIGDDVLTDVHGAQSVGMSGILVKTGKYLNGDEESINPPPSAVCDDFSSAVKLIKKSLVTSSEQFNTKHN